MNDPAHTRAARPSDYSIPPDPVTALAAIALVALLASQLLGLEPASQGFSLAPREMTGCVMDQAGFLRGELYGEVRQTLDWQGEAMACDGMPKPDGRGVRLAFRQYVDPDLAGLVVVIAIDNVAPGASFEEEPANVTINDQQGGRFYSSLGADRCWVSLRELVELTGTVDPAWRMNGLLYCLSALPAANGGGTVTLNELEFSGLLRADAE